MQIDYSLSNRIDWAALKREFGRRGRVEIPDLLADGQAAALRAALLGAGRTGRS